VLAVLCLLALPTVGRGQAVEPVTVVPAIYSTDAVTRNADLSLAGAAIATAAVDKAIAAAWSPRPGGAAARSTRLAKFLLFDVPVVTFLVGLNHEGGHMVRAREQGFPYSFAIVGSPWSARPFELLALDPRIFDDLGSQTGGLEASRRLKDRSEASLWRAERAAPGHALATIIASLDLPIYAWHNLSADGSSDSGDRNGDPIRVLEILARRNGVNGAAARDALRTHMRRHSTWNLADTMLWSLAYGLVRDHLWNGERGLAVRWLRIGGVDWLPGVRYEWTPLGAESSVRSHHRTAAHVGTTYVRWTERLAGQRLLGAGGSVSWQAGRSLTPRVDVDAWSHTADGAGLHAAASLELSRPANRAVSVLVAAGAKSEGHLGSLPPDAGAYMSAGLVLRIW
jgi:hypothetical protein